MNVIPEPEIEQDKGKIIKDVYAELGWEENEEPEQKYFDISYKFYNDKHCGIDNLKTQSYKKFTQYLKKIGKNCTIQDIEKELNKGDRKIVKPVQRSGEYQKIYNKLLQLDITIHEIILNSSNRLFFFITENKFYIVAIKDRHFETKKNRR